jgi:hypothetical protein
MHTFCVRLKDDKKCYLRNTTYFTIVKYINDVDDEHFFCCSTLVFEYSTELWFEISTLLTFAVILAYR